MGDITLSSAVRNNLLSLQDTAVLLGKTQERLSTGLKVNSALDDPASFFTAAALNNRASDLNRLLDSVGLAVQTIEAADEGITAITDLVEAAQASARQALQSPGAVTPNVAASVVGTGASVAADAAAVSTGTVTTVAADSAAVATGTVTNIAADVAAVGTGTVITGGDALELDVTNLNIADGTTITISDGTTSRTFEFDTGGDGVAGGNFALGGTNQTLSAAITAINGELSTAGVNATVTDVDAGADTQIQVQSTNATDSIQVTTGGAGSASVLAAIGIDGIGAGPDATDRTVSPTNTTLDGITAGQTLTFTTAAGSSTVTFGTASGQSNTRVELLAALNGGSSGATFTDTGNTLTVTGASAAAGDITVAASSGASALTALGFTSAAVSSATNTTLDAITAGQTLTFTTAAGDSTVTFGTGSGQSNTQTEVLAALNGGASGASFAFTGNTLVATGANVAAGDITVNASSGASALSGLGFTSGDVSETTNATLGAITQGQTLTIDIGGTTETVTFGSASGEVNTAAELNTRLAAIQTAFGAGTTVSADTSGNLTVTSSDTTSSVTLGGTAALTTFGTNLTTTAVAPGTGTTVNNSARAAAEAQFNTLRTQIDQLSADASFNGNNLLQGDDLSAIFNSAGTSSLTITGVTYDSAGLGINAATSGAFQSNTAIQSTLSELDTAISTLRTQASTFGSNLSVVETRQQFTNNLINVLETGAGNLTLADTNEEGANLLALQTRQQLSSVSLSLASQADQAVLRLF